MNQSGPSNLPRKAAALLEVLGVFMAGNFMAGCLGSFIGIKSLGPILDSTAESAAPDFVPLAVAFLQAFLVQYACLLPLAFAMGCWRRRLKPRLYGVTRAGQPVSALVNTGLLAFALVAMPFKLLWVAKRFVPLGQGSPFWALLDKSWTPSFWLLMAVASFAIVPVLEELFYRGYCQTRLEEDFGGIGAIIIVTLFLSLGHSQYHHLSIMSIETILGLIPMMLGMGYVYWRSRSLILAMILHAAVNFPTKGIYDFVLPAAMAAVLILFRNQWFDMARDFSRSWADRGWKRSAFVATLLFVTASIGLEQWPGMFIPFGFLALAVALLIEFRERRMERITAQIKS